MHTNACKSDVSLKIRISVAVCATSQTTTLLFVQQQPQSSEPVALKAETRDTLEQAVQGGSRISIPGGDQEKGRSGTE